MARQAVGLDIGTSAVRAVQLSLGTGRPALVAFGQVALPHGVVVDGEVINRAAVTAAIRRLWKDGRFHHTSVHMSVAGLRAITRELEMPDVPDPEIDKAVRYQADEHLPFPAEQTILSTKVIGRTRSPEGEAMVRVTVAAAHRDLVEGVVAAVTAAGLVPVEIDLTSSSLVRAMAAAEPEGVGTEAVVNVGAGMTIVAVHRGGSTEFVRTIGQGGDSATEAISGTIGMPIGDAEAIKRRLWEGRPETADAERATRQPVGALVAEVRSTLDFFDSLPGRPPVARIVLSGAGSLLPGLRERLDSETGVPVFDARPVAGIDVSRVSLSEGEEAFINRVLPAPVGAALPTTSRADHRFNLLPPDLGNRMRDRVLGRRVLAGVALLVAVLGVVYAARALHIRQAQDEVNTANQSIATLNAQVAKYNNVVATRQQIRIAQARVAEAVAGEVSWPTVLDQLARQIPSTVTLTSFTGTSVTPPTTAPPSGSSGTTGSGTGSTGAGSGAQPAASTPPASLPPLSATLANVNVTATGPAFGGAASWITQMSSSPAFTNVFVTSVTQAQNPPAGQTSAVTFNSTFTVTGAAHSSRLTGILRIAS